MTAKGRERDAVLFRYRSGSCFLCLHGNRSQSHPRCRMPSPQQRGAMGRPPPLPRHTVARDDVDDDGDSAHALVRALPRKPTAPPPPSLSRPAATGSPAVCAARTRRWRRGRSGCLSAPYLGAWVLGARDDPVRTTVHGRVSLSTI